MGWFGAKGSCLEFFISLIFCISRSGLGGVILLSLFSLFLLQLYDYAFSCCYVWEYTDFIASLSFMLTVSQARPSAWPCGF